MPETKQGPLADRVRVAWAYSAMVILAYLAVILEARQPPAMVDYPDWVYQGVLFHGLLTGHPVAGYALKGYPVPNSLTTVALGLIDCVLPWVWAAKLWVCLYLAMAFVASRILARAVSSTSGRVDWRLVVTLPAVLFLNLDFWYGHISFEIGLCLLLVLLAMLLGRRSTAAIAVILTTMFFAHMEACACGLLLLVVWSWREGRWERIRAAAPAVALTVWYAVGRYGTGNIDGRSVTPAAHRWGSPAFLAYKAGAFLKVFGYVNARSADGSSITEAIFGRSFFVLLVVAGSGLAVLCLWLIGRFVREGRGTMRWFVVALVALAAISPQVVLGVADPGSRLLLAGAAAAFFVMRWHWRSGTAVAALSVVFCAVNLLQFSRLAMNPRMQGQPKDLPPVVLGFGHVEPTERLRVYAKLRRGEMDEAVFQTGMFRIVGR